MQEAFLNIAQSQSSSSALDNKEIETSGAATIPGTANRDITESTNDTGITYFYKDKS